MLSKNVLSSITTSLTERFNVKSFYEEIYSKYDFLLSASFRENILSYSNETASMDTTKIYQKNIDGEIKYEDVYILSKQFGGPTFKIDEVVCLIKLFAVLRHTPTLEGSFSRKFNIKYI